jgi:hypothetical protein
LRVPGVEPSRRFPAASGGEAARRPVLQEAHALRNLREDCKKVDYQTNDYLTIQRK